MAVNYHGKSFIKLAHVGNVKYRGNFNIECRCNLPWNFNPGIYRSCSKLPWYVYNIGLGLAFSFRRDCACLAFTFLWSETAQRLGSFLFNNAPTGHADEGTMTIQSCHLAKRRLVDCRSTDAVDFFENPFLDFFLLQNSSSSLVYCLNHSVCLNCK
jgi:hypothetical protein